MDTFLSTADIEKQAKKCLSVNAWEYLLGYSERGTTYHRNIDFFNRYLLKQHVSRDVENRKLSATIQGQTISIPVGISPTGYQKLYWPDGEISMAEGAKMKNTCMILSNHSSATLEQVTGASTCMKWMQIYIYKDREATKKMIDDADRFGFSGIVLTVDSAAMPWDRRPYHLERPEGVHPEVLVNANILKKGEPGVTRDLLDDSSTWEDVKWIVGCTNLPVILKGIMTGEDARSAVKYGAAGIIVSNHGGRQLDSVPSTIEALPEVVKAVGGSAEVYLDVGIRYGTDIFKALALGARAVFIGRPAVWGLSVGGAEGVARVLTILEKQFDTAMALTGCRSVEDIDQTKLILDPYSSQF